MVFQHVAHCIDAGCGPAVHRDRLVSGIDVVTIVCCGPRNHDVHQAADVECGFISTGSGVILLHALPFRTVVDGDGFRACGVGRGN